MSREVSGEVSGGAGPRETREGAGEAGPPTRPLASIVRGEATRAEAEARILPDPARVAAGWQRRFVIERVRAADLVALYERAGFEVAVDTVAPELLQDECSDCKLVMRMDYVQVYTRGGPAAG
jgi:hypothetical protein